MSCLASLGWNLEQGGRSSRNDGVENWWVWSAVVASLPLVVAVGKAHGCTIAAAIVAAGTTTVAANNVFWSSVQWSSPNFDSVTQSQLLASTGSVALANSRGCVAQKSK
jgi:hypothetical protein